MKTFVKKVIRAFLAAWFRVIDAPKRRSQVVVAYTWPDFARKSRAIADLLTRQGFNVVIRTGDTFLNRVRIKFGGQLHIGFWNEFYLDYLPTRYIFYNAEPLSVPRWKDDGRWFKAMRGARQVWGYVADHARYVEPLHVPYHFVPFGYAPYYEESFRASIGSEVITKDVDVLFVGKLLERRQELVDRMKEAGIAVHTVTLLNPVYGADLDRLLARSKIILGIHQFDDPEAQIIDFARIDHLLSNRLFVIHEKPSTRNADPEFEANVTTCSYDDFITTCRFYLEHPEERDARASAAHDWFVKARSMNDRIPYDQIRALLSSTS